MGTLDFLVGGSLAPRIAPGPANTGFVMPDPGRSTQQQRQLPERFNLNQAFDSASQSGASLFGTLGQLPARVYESPVSLLDVASQRTLGFSPVDAIGQTPVGGVAGFLGGAVERAGNFAPALINSTDANIWKVVGDLPDDTEITDDLVQRRLKAMGEGTLFAEGEDTGGVPILGSLPFLRHIFGGRPKTVGELRVELAKRGFFYDTDGTPIDPTQMALDLRSGTRSTFDFGNRSVNDNAMVDLAARLGLDPTNALFFVPGGAFAKVGASAAKLLPASRLIRSGQLAARAPSALASANAIQKGSRAGATLAGLGKVLRGYRTASIGTALGTFGANRLSSLVNDLTDDELPFLPEIEEFTNAVQERRPMSDNAAFMLFGAATFPYSRYARGTINATRAARAKVFGVGDMAPFYKEWGGKDRFYEDFGGKPGERQLADFIDKQIARDMRRLSPREVANIQSVPDLALRRRIEQQALERVVDQMRRNGEITGDMRLAKFREWHEGQAGFEGKGIANPWNPTRAASRWRAFEPVREMVDPILRETGEVIWGLRDDVIFTEQIDAVRDVLRGARYTAPDGKVRVDTQAILDVLEDHPNLNALDRHGFWVRFANRQAEAPTWDSISRRLTRTRRESVKIEDYTQDLALWERNAEPDVPEPTPILNRQDRIEELRVRLSELESQPRDLGPDSVPGSANPFDHAELRTVAAFRHGLTTTTRGIRSVDSLIPEYVRDDSTVSTESILSEGVREPIKITPGGRVLDGHNRLIAAKKAGLTEVPVEIHRLPDNDMALAPEILAEHQAVQRELEDLLAEENGIHWARTAARDRRSGADPEVGRTAEESLPVEVAPVHLSPGLDKLPPEVVQRVNQLEAELIQANPSYRLKRAPTKEILALVPEDGAIATAIRQHTALGEWLHLNGPLSKMSGFVHALSRPVARNELYTDAKNSLAAEMATHGAKGRKVEAFLAELREEVKRSERHPFGFIPGLGDFTIRLKRDIGSIEPSEVNRIGGEIFGPKVTASVGRGGYYRILSKASSRYWRTLDDKAAKGNKAAAVGDRVYRVWNDSPAFSQVAAAQRTLAKYYYPLFRFVADVRWLALNAVEANILSLGKDGMRKAYGSAQDATNAARYFRQGLDAEAAASFVPDTGWSLGRQLDLFALKLFDKRSAKSVAKVIDELGENDPALASLRANMLREANDNLAHLESQYKAGDITDRVYQSQRAKIERQMRASSEDLATHLNDTLYRYETQGVEATVLEEARAILDADEMRAMQPLIDRVVEINRKTWDDVQHMLHGNPARSTMERLANSYWLYWPISYQIKATQWLGNIMLGGSFGHNNNALLAGKYALWQQQHEERIKNNPAYRALFAAQPTLWFAAQMFLPMAPEDIGVSLSRATRLAGTVGQNQLNEWFGTDIGAFTAQKELEDPGNMVTWLTNMGPIYTIELINRLSSEFDDESNESPALPAITAPIPPTAGGQIPVPVR